MPDALSPAGGCRPLGTPRNTHIYLCRDSGGRERLDCFGFLRVPGGSFSTILRLRSSFCSSGAHFCSILRIRSPFCSVPEAPELFFKDFQGSGATNSIILYPGIQIFSHFVATMPLISSCCSCNFIAFIVLYLHTQSFGHSIIICFIKTENIS